MSTISKTIPEIRSIRPTEFLIILDTKNAPKINPAGAIIAIPPIMVVLTFFCSKMIDINGVNRLLVIPYIEMQPIKVAIVTLYLEFIIMSF